MSNRQQFQFDLYGMRSIGYGIPTHTADPEFAWFTDVLYGRDGEYVWCEVMKIRKSSIVGQPDLFAAPESELAELAYYGDASDD